MGITPTQLVGPLGRTMAQEEIAKLSLKIRKTLCATAEHDRLGEREVPLVDEFEEIVELIEDALHVPRGTLQLLGQQAGCNHPDCYVCE